MRYDEILEKIGEFGRYQKVKYGLACFLFVMVCWQNMVSVFSIYMPPHRCRLPVGAIQNMTDSWKIQSPEHQALVDDYIPLAEDGGYSSCDVYTTPKLSANHTPEVRQCDSWVYDDTEMLTTAVTRMDLVCSKKLYGTLATSMLMFGTLVGSLICGILSDTLGRKKAILVGVVGQTVSGLVLAFTPEYYSFTAFRFFSGVFSVMVLLTSYVLSMEMVGPSKRVTVGFVIMLCWAVGFIALDVVAYFIRIDQYIQLAITLPALFSVSYQWILPESARWLLAKRRIREAENLIHKIARGNGTTVPEDMELELEQVRPPESMKELLRAPKLLCRTVIILFNWFVISLTYYGISLNSGNLPGSLYVNLLFTASSEVVGYLLCFLCFFLGRKAPIVVGMSVGGLASIASVAVYYGMDGEGHEQTKNWIFLILNNIGKVGATVGFGIIYLWSGEIFPTVLRTSLVGLSSTAGRIGTVICPYIADIGKLVPPQYSQMLPPLIFGIITIAGGLSAVALPETSGCDLPETIAEANTFPEKLEMSEEEEKFDQSAM